ncbi:S-adenosylmethionine:tRNA ribosyltransferase-isomerase [Acidiferrimicrobium sp. IK]|uniref:S-adenosylmethionine:tRNA ribosyltransferase-isomerase n=1 Tax=Acidiferrimicrobium sp. IK TaxID=2871700 RepID=UPI003967C109
MTRIRNRAGEDRADPLAAPLPPGAEATAPPEERGLARDEVRLLVADPAGGIEHRRFRDLPDVLERGDLLVVNTSATLPAALPASVADQPGVLHLSGRLPAGLWQVELRHPAGGATSPWLDAEPGTVIDLPAGGWAALLAPASSPPERDGRSGIRLWLARLELPEPLLGYLAANGKPIRYGYVTAERPLAAYQTVFADQPGSAEMPSAARPFSAELVTRLAARGVVFAPFTLHCGVSSPEAHEPPPTEWYELPAESAALVNGARAGGHRVIAVGTTAVRALETVAGAGGVVHPGRGWTDLVVTSDRPVTTIDGLITGWHEPQASHLEMLQAVAGRPVLEASYTAARTGRYLWHEFGDSHLLLR